MYGRKKDGDKVQSGAFTKANKKNKQKGGDKSSFNYGSSVAAGSPYPQQQQQQQQGGMQWRPYIPGEGGTGRQQKQDQWQTRGRDPWYGSATGGTPWRGVTYTVPVPKQQAQSSASSAGTGSQQQQQGGGKEQQQQQEEQQKKTVYRTSYSGVFISSLIFEGPSVLFPSSLDRAPGGFIALLGAVHPEGVDETPTTAAHTEVSRAGEEHGNIHVYVDPELVRGVTDGPREWDVLFEGLSRKYKKTPLRFVLPALNYHRRMSLLTYLRTRWDRLLAARAAYQAKDDKEGIDEPKDSLQLIIVSDTPQSDDDVTIRAALQLAQHPEVGTEVVSSCLL